MEASKQREGDSLYWYCKKCGDGEYAEPPYVLGDKEKCINCGESFAEVMPISVAAKHEQAFALRAIEEK